MILEKIKTARGYVCELVCDYCGKNYYTKFSDIKNYKKHYCCENCQDAGHSIEMLGEGNPKWIGGKILNRGYVLVYKPDHPNRKDNGYVFEHRLVVEKFIKRYLKPDEFIHHINEDTSDNRIENLLIVNNVEHKRIYHGKTH